MRWYYFLVLLPVLALTVGIFYVNRVEPFVFGMPFLMFWIVAWLVVTVIVMSIINYLDGRQDKGRK